MVGAALSWLWRYLELPVPSNGMPPVRRMALLLAIGFAGACLWNAMEWQNSIRVLWHMEARDSAGPLLLVGVAIAAFVVLLGLGRLFRLAVARFAGWTATVIPRRVANVLGLAMAALLFWTAGQGLLLRWALNATDASFQSVDALVDDDIPAPTQAAKAGSAASLVSWEGLGRQGRHFVSSGPTASEIGAFWK